MTRLSLRNDLINSTFPGTAPLWIAVAVALFLFLGAASTAHAHADQGKPSEYTTQAITGALSQSNPQDDQEEPPTCHHGTVPCYTGYSMSNAGLANAPRSANTVPFSIMTGFPTASFLSIDPPPPKQRTAELH
jgi:hypothetical protein